MLQAGPGQTADGAPGPLGQADGARRNCPKLQHMETHIVKLLSIKQVTHNVKSFRVEKPAGYAFVPGQATEVSIHKPGWEEERRPFTFTSLNEDPWLEFTIKRYADHAGVTNALHQLAEGDELIIRDVWGAI